MTKAQIKSNLQEQLPSDLVRVNTLFQKAREAGIDIEASYLS